MHPLSPKNFLITIFLEESFDLLPYLEKRPLLSEVFNVLLPLDEVHFEEVVFDDPCFLFENLLLLD